MAAPLRPTSAGNTRQRNASAAANVNLSGSISVSARLIGLILLGSIVGSIQPDDDADPIVSAKRNNAPHSDLQCELHCPHQGSNRTAARPVGRR